MFLSRTFCGQPVTKETAQIKLIKPLDAVWKMDGEMNECTENSDYASLTTHFPPAVSPLLEPALRRHYCLISTQTTTTS